MEAQGRARSSPWKRSIGGALCAAVLFLATAACADGVDGSAAADVPDVAPADGGPEVDAVYAVEDLEYVDLLGTRLPEHTGYAGLRMVPARRGVEVHWAGTPSDEAARLLETAPDGLEVTVVDQALVTEADLLRALDAIREASNMGLPALEGLRGLGRTLDAVVLEVEDVASAHAGGLEQALRAIPGVGDVPIRLREAGSVHHR